MYVQEKDLQEKDYTLVGQVANLAVYKRDLAKKITSLAFLLKDDPSAYNVKLVVVDSSMVELIANALNEKNIRVLQELIDINYY